MYNDKKLLFNPIFGKIYFTIKFDLKQIIINNFGKISK